MSQFKEGDRVKITSVSSAYLNQYGTIVETDLSSSWVSVDGVKRKMRFSDFELIPAPHVPAPGEELTRTQAYLRELDEDTNTLFDAASLCPQGTTTQKDLHALAVHQAKIVTNLKVVLGLDGVTFREAEDGGK